MESPLEWYKRYTNRANHGQMYEAGFWGGVVFDALCDSSAAYDLEGRLPKVYAEPEYLARQLRLTEAEVCICHETSRNVTTAKNDSVTHENHVVTVLSDALKRLFWAGLVVKEGDLVVIDGWERKQRKVPKSDAERSRNYREKKKSKAEADSNNKPIESVTKRHIQESDANVCVTHREEESREEKIREDKKRINKKQKANALSPQTSATPEQKPTSSEKEKTTEAKPESAYKSLKTALEASYKQKRGEEYLFAHGKDGSALKRLIERFTHNAILERWERGLESEGYLRINTVAELYSKWNALVSAPTPEQASKSKSNFYASREVSPDVWKAAKEKYS